MSSLNKLNIEIEEARKGCIKQLEWDDGIKTGTSGCGEDGIYCDECQAVLKALELGKEAVEEVMEDEVYFLDEIYNKPYVSGLTDKIRKRMEYLK